MVNKDRIHGEIRDFREIFWNLIKSADELVIEIRENSRFRKITQRRIHGIKSLNLDSYSQRNQRAKWREISERDLKEIQN